MACLVEVAPLALGGAALLNAQGWLAGQTPLLPGLLT
jgi:hypothetical protein